jgi:hypothetical protein
MKISNFNNAMSISMRHNLKQVLKKDTLSRVRLFCHNGNPAIMPKVESTINIVPGTFTILLSSRRQTLPKKIDNNIFSPPKLS